MFGADDSDCRSFVANVANEHSFALISKICFILFFFYASLQLAIILACYNFHLLSSEHLYYGQSVCNEIFSLAMERINLGSFATVCAFRVFFNAFQCHMRQN